MIANYLLDLADGQRQPMTQASLLKIIYFCHGWYLIWKNQKLSANDFEAWEYGPVVRVVREAFKSYGRRTIKSRAERFNVYTGEFEQIPDEIAEKDRFFIAKIFDYYSRFSTPELIEMTHEKGSPWDRLWNSDRPVARLGLRIKDDEIREHFSRSARPERLV
jgi:uncharacterized phage-associated protein